MTAGNPPVRVSLRRSRVTQISVLRSAHLFSVVLINTLELPGKAFELV